MMVASYLEVYTVAIPTHNFTWQQGEDAVIHMVYKVDSEPVDLTGASLRMDVGPAGSAKLYTFNSSEAGPEDDIDDEAVLGADGSINIRVPRAVTLPGGPLASSVGSVLEYDVFLRIDGKQRKILKGEIFVEASKTLWN